MSTPVPNRIQSGVREGGQFATSARPDSDVALAGTGAHSPIIVDLPAQLKFAPGIFLEPPKFPASLGEPKVEFGLSDYSTPYTSVSWGDGGDSVIMQDDGYGEVDEDLAVAVEDDADVEAAVQYARAVHANVSSAQAVLMGKLLHHPGVREQMRSMATGAGRN